jgi:hypothetical protein
MFCEKEYEDVLLGIGYDKIITLPYEEMYDFPEWADSGLHKIFAMSLMDEPFIYLDPTSVFFTDKKLKEIKDKDIIYLNQDLGKDIFVNKSQKILNKRPVFEDLSFKNRYYNTGVFGGNDFNTIKKSSKIILNFLKENAEYLDFICGDNMLNLEDRSSLYFANLARTIDSVWLPQLCEYISKKPLFALFSNSDTQPLEQRAYDLESDSESFEIQDTNSIIYKYAERHNDIILKLKAENNFYDRNPLSPEEINKIKGFAMMKYGITF